MTIPQIGRSDDHNESSNAIGSTSYKNRHSSVNSSINESPGSGVSEQTGHLKKSKMASNLQQFDARVSNTVNQDALYEKSPLVDNDYFSKGFGGASGNNSKNPSSKEGPPPSNSAIINSAVSVGTVGTASSAPSSGLKSYNSSNIPTSNQTVILGTSSNLSQDRKASSPVTPIPEETKSEAASFGAASQSLQGSLADSNTNMSNKDNFPNSSALVPSNTPSQATLHLYPSAEPSPVADANSSTHLDEIEDPG